MQACRVLAGLVLPSDLVKISRIPADSTMARTAPPAMTPVPGAAGLSITSEAAKRYLTMKGMVVPASGTSISRFLASSAPFRMASVYSAALPRPKPTCPLRSPTTTSARMLKRRPPFTTLETRRTCTTVSSRFSFDASILGIFSPRGLRNQGRLHERLLRAQPRAHDRRSHHDQRQPD